MIRRVRNGSLRRMVAHIIAQMVTLMSAWLHVRSLGVHVCARRIWGGVCVGVLAAACTPSSAPPPAHPSCATVAQVMARHPDYRLRARPERPPNIIILMVDALGAAHLSGYGYARMTSPFMDQLAREGTRFANAFVHATQTVPSVASLLTGAIPPVHGVSNYASINAAGQVVSHTLHESNVTIAELLQAHGYRTGAFIANTLIDTRSGYHQGFDAFYVRNLMPASQLHARAVAWLAEESDRPALSYIHYMDVHVPYSAGPPYQRLFRSPKGKLFLYNGVPTQDVAERDALYTVARYDGQIRYLDDQLRLLWTMLAERNLLENTLVILISDHGDEFMQHGGFGHATSLYDELLHVPLIIWYPGVIPAGVTREELVFQTDVFPTIAALVDVPVSTLPLAGQNLFPLFPMTATAPADTAPRELYAEVMTYKAKVELKALRTCTEKVILSTGGANPPVREFYNLLTDPQEQTNTYAADNARIQALEKRVRAIAHAPVARPSVETPVDAAGVEALKSLGYVE